MSYRGTDGTLAGGFIATDSLVAYAIR